MKVERSSVDQVRQRFEILKKAKEEKKKEYDLTERIQELKEEVLFWNYISLFSFSKYLLLSFRSASFLIQEEKMKEYRREKRKEQRKRKHNEVDSRQEQNEDEDDMAAMMGFSGFGSSKKWKQIRLLNPAARKKKVHYNCFLLWSIMIATPFSVLLIFVFFPGFIILT